MQAHVSPLWHTLEQKRDEWLSQQTKQTRVDHVSIL